MRAGLERYLSPEQIRMLGGSNQQNPVDAFIAALPPDVQSNPTSILQAASGTPSLAHAVAEKFGLNAGGMKFENPYRHPMSEALVAGAKDVLIPWGAATGAIALTGAGAGGGAAAAPGAAGGGATTYPLAAAGGPITVAPLGGAAGAAGSAGGAAPATSAAAPSAEGGDSSFFGKIAKLIPRGGGGGSGVGYDQQIAEQMMQQERQRLAQRHQSLLQDWQHRIARAL